MGLHQVIISGFVYLELAQFAGAGELLFTDQSAAAQIDASHSPSVWLYLSSLNVASFLSGGAVGDFNNDGYQDFLVLMGGTSADKLYINNGDGTFTDQATEWGVAYAHMGVGTAVGDYDGDGYLDIFVTSLGPAVAPTQPGQHLLYHNNGNGSFTNVAADAGVNATSTTDADGFGATFGDYDLDGDLDLMVVGWVVFSGGNRLFRNNSDGTFTDVTDESGLAVLIDSRGYSPRFVDMNGDRYPELLIAGDFGTSRYLINNGDGSFTDWTGPSGTGLEGNGMGHTVGDFDGNGLLDWYVTSVYSPDSHLPGVPGTGNMLYLNQGDHAFLEAATEYGCSDGGWGWGADGSDFDQDGLIDIAETNGWSQDNGPYGPEWLEESSYLFRNLDHHFADGTSTGFEHVGQGRGLASLDYDNDGDRDLLHFGFNEPLVLYRNEVTGPNANWLRVIVDTSSTPNLAPNGFGSMVRISIDGTEQYRSIDGGSNYLVQSELSAHFGTGAATMIDEVRVDFPDGSFTRVCNISANQSLTVQPLLADLNADGVVGVYDLLTLIATWGPCEQCEADLDGDNEVDVVDLLILLSTWGNCS